QLTHHLCHATAAKAMSPFERSLILVMDGAGSARSDFALGDPELGVPGLDGVSEASRDLPPHALEECSVYTLDSGRLRCVLKRWQLLARERYGEGSGLFFEEASKYVFNC